MSEQTPLSVKRLMNDFKKLQSQELVGVNARPDSANIYHWDAVVFGPENTPYEDGTFHLTLDFPNSYPMAAPLVRFDPTIFHPNIYNNGCICLDILNKVWSPTFSISTILLSIQALLITPNPNSPANAEAAALYQSNRAEYDKRVKESVEMSWAAAARLKLPNGSSLPSKENENGNGNG